MTQLPINSILTENGAFEIRELDPGREHLLTLKNVFSGATVVLETFNTVLDKYTSVDDGSWTNEAEIRFIPTSNKASLTVSGASGSTSIGVTITPII